MITIYLNDQPCVVEASRSLQEVLLKNHYEGEHMAIAVNYQFIPRSAFDNTILAEGDRIDVIVPMQGG